MGPKRSRKVVSVKKVVRETVQVAIVETNNDSQIIKEDDITTVDQHHQEETTTLIKRTIPVEDRSTTKTTQKDTKEDHDQPKEAVTEEETETQNEEEHGQRQGVENDVVAGKLEKKTTSSSNNKGKRKRRTRRFDQVQGGTEYKRYVFRVLKQVHPGMAISAKAMTVINNMMNDMFERLADEAARLSAYTGKRTLSSREVQAAVSLVLPGDLSRHAIAEGTKAVANYMSTTHQHHSAARSDAKSNAK